MKTATLSTSYDSLDMGIILVDINLEVFFMNTWLVRKVPISVKQTWTSSKPLNLKTLLTPDAFSKIEKIDTLVRKTIQDKSVQLISRSFHEWLIPLNDPRFVDGRMRQSCIFSPYAYPELPAKLPGRDQIPLENRNFFEETMALIQIKDESDTVLRAENLKKSRENLHRKNQQLIQANAHLAQMNQKLHQQEAYLRQVSKIEALGRMTGGIAHNFNNYLAVILGNTEMILNDTHSSDHRYEFLENIKDISLTARDMIRQLLLYSHPDLEAQKHTRLNLGKTIPKLMPLLTAIAPDVIHIEFQMDGHPPFTVQATDSQIHEILLNLVKNAVHAIENPALSSGMQTELNAEKNRSQRQIKGHIKVILGQETIENNRKKEKYSDLPSFLPVLSPDILNSGSYITLTVTDTGHGIAPEHLDKLFDPYFTTRDVGRGTGIGLSVVHGIVSHLKGAIQVKTQVENGSTFTVFLPAETGSIGQLPQKGLNGSLARDPAGESGL